MRRILQSRERTPLPTPSRVPRPTPIWAPVNPHASRLSFRIPLSPDELEAYNSARSRITFLLRANSDIPSQISAIESAIDSFLSRRSGSESFFAEHPPEERQRLSRHLDRYRSLIGESHRFAETLELTTRLFFRSLQESTEKAEAAASALRARLSSVGPRVRLAKRLVAVIRSIDLRRSFLALAPAALHAQEFAAAQGLAPVRVGFRETAERRTRIRALEARAAALRKAQPLRRQRQARAEVAPAAAMRGIADFQARAVAAYLAVVWRRVGRHSGVGWKLPRRRRVAVSPRRGCRVVGVRRMIGRADVARLVGEDRRRMEEEKRRVEQMREVERTAPVREEVAKLVGQRDEGNAKLAALKKRHEEEIAVVKRRLLLLNQRKEALRQKGKL